MLIVAPVTPAIAMPANKSPENGPPFNSAHATPKSMTIHGTAQAASSIRARSAVCHLWWIGIILYDMMEKNIPTLETARQILPTKTRVLAFHVLAWVLSPTGDRRKESKGGRGGAGGNGI